MKPLSRRQRRAKKKEADKHGATTKSMERPSTSFSSSDPKKVSKWRNDMLAGLNDPEGPSPGVKYRGGTPPSPPAWNYARDDLRAFQKWQRKVDIWQLQVSSYVPPNEAAMLCMFRCVWIFEDQSEWRCSIHCRCFEAATADSFYLLEAKISAWIRICTKVQWRNHQEFLQSIQPYREEPPFSWNPSRRHVWQWKQGS